MNEDVEKALEVMDARWGGYGNAKAIIRQALREQESVIVSQRAMIWYLARCQGEQSIPMKVIEEYNPVKAFIEIGIRPNGDRYITAHLGAPHDKA